ncbi:MAG TPA: hypothetical protein VJ692_15095 [Nitrospiraceae bacterium]|nr:hypothetical protein [Nitrospiraceae bacterium]
MNEAALQEAIRKLRKLRMVDHIPMKDSPPPAITFKGIMERGLGGMYEDAAIEYAMRRFLKYYLEAARQPRL